MASLAVPWLGVAVIALLLGAAWLVAHTRAAITGTAEVIQTQRDGLAALPALIGASGTDDDAPAPAGTSVVISSGPGKFEGRVVDEQKRPVAGAEVTFECHYIYGQTDAPLPRTTTTALGGFVFEADADCLATLIAIKDDRMARDTITRSAPRDLVLAPPVVISVHVVDAETGAAIGGAEVETGGRNAATTDTGGHAELRLPRNQFGAQPHEVLFVRARGYTSAVDGGWSPDRTAESQARTAQVDPLAVRTIRLARGIAVRGQVLGAGLTRVTMYMFGPINPDGPVVRRGTRALPGVEAGPAGPDGRFEIWVPRPGRYELVPDARNMPALQIVNEAEIQIDVGTEGRSDVVIHMASRPGMGIAGTVVDAAGAPVAGARVTAPRGLMRPVTTDERGQFAIPDATVRGGPHRLLARHGALASDAVSVEIQQDRLMPITLRLGPAGVSGVVVDPEGYVVPGAEVYLNPSDDLSSSGFATTDAEGRFSFDVPRGSFVFSVRRSSEHDFLDEDDRVIAGGTHHVRLVVP
ncbi:MAG: carboxypeptidase regulatory-like domain-containing protein [Myxococcales bacterium]|nr:carboxypeptidase regulatory-like domain-containing protein [Myxococcales bacterium]